MLHAQRHQQFTIVRRIVRCVRLFGVYVKYAQQRSVRSVERKRHVLVRLNREHRRDFQRHSAGVVINLNHRGVIDGCHRNRDHDRRDQLRQRALVARISLVVHRDRQFFRQAQLIANVVVVVLIRNVRQAIQRGLDLAGQTTERYGVRSIARQPQQHRKVRRRAAQG